MQMRSFVVAPQALIVVMDENLLEEDVTMTTEKPHATLFSIAQADALDLAGGRYAGAVKSHVTGSAPIAQVPRQPSNSPWNQFDKMPAEPLIDGRSEGDICLVPTGEIWEQERSLRELASSHGEDGVKAPSALIQPSVGGAKKFRRRV
jgi:hypothetical protein